MDMVRTGLRNNIAGISLTRLRFVSGYREIVKTQEHAYRISKIETYFFLDGHSMPIEEV